MTLAEAMPKEFVGGSYHDCRAFKFKDVKVLGIFDTSEPGHSWPGSHKNVVMWVELVNGYAVGWNENPARGWSFPVVKLPAPSSAPNGGAR